VQTPFKATKGGAERERKILTNVMRPEQTYLPALVDRQTLTAGKLSDEREITEKG
jgi:hypothetical protein